MSQRDTTVRGGRKILRYNDSIYVADDVVEIGKRSKISKIAINELALDAATLTPGSCQEVKEVIYIKRGNSFVLLLGKEVVDDFMLKGNPVVPGRLISAFALKQAKV